MFITDKELQANGFPPRFSLPMLTHWQPLAKYEINLHNLYPECKEKLHKAIRSDKDFETDQLYTKNGTETLKITKYKNKILIEADNIGDSFEHLLSELPPKLYKKYTTLPEEKQTEIINKAIKVFGIDDYDTKNIYAEYEFCETDYSKIANQTNSMYNKINVRVHNTSKNFEKFIEAELAQTEETC